MKIAVVMTVKNEERLLFSNILYHKYIGVDNFFVYSDYSDKSRYDSIKGMDSVVFSKTVPTKKYENLVYCKHFINNYDRIFTARQALNSFDATLLCKAKNIEWLISIDADELICVDLCHQKKDDLKTFFLGIGKDVDVVALRTFEIIQNQLAYKNVFAEEILFKNKKCFRYLFSNKLKAIYNPINKKTISSPWWYGQTLGKCAINVNSGLIQRTSHEFQSISNNPLKVENKGYLLHYYVYDFEDFYSKFKRFKDHPDQYLYWGEVEDLKKIWRDVVNYPGYNESDLINYYKNNVMCSEYLPGSSMIKNLDNYVYRNIIKVYSPKKIFEALKSEKK